MKVTDAMPLPRVYTTPSYHDPYELGPGSLSFSCLDDVLQWTADKTRLPISVILPGNRRQHGQSMNAQFIGGLAKHLHSVWTKLGTLDGKDHILELNSQISWECDDFGLCQIPTPSDAANSLKPYHLSDLQKYFENTSTTDAIEELLGSQRLAYARACGTLETHNLIVVGSSKANQVMANLHNVLLLNSRCLAQLGMYLHPSVGRAPLTLRRSHPTDTLWTEHEWKDRNIGWLHMIRNPWSLPSAPRFLIYVGGFYVQGTPAAVLKLIEIVKQIDTDLDDVLRHDPMARVAARRSAQSARAGTGRFDLQSPVGLLPARVVNAECKMPWNWFVDASRPGLGAVNPLRFETPPSYEGTVEGFTDV